MKNHYAVIFEGGDEFDAVAVTPITDEYEPGASVSRASSVDPGRIALWTILSEHETSAQAVRASDKHLCSNRKPWGPRRVKYVGAV